MATANKNIPKSNFLPLGMSDILYQRGIEFIGVGMIAIAIALTISFTSYTPADPSLNTSSSIAETQNLLGAIGALVSDILLQTIGISSTFLIILLCGWGWRLITINHVNSPCLRLAILPLGILLTCLTLSYLNPHDSWLFKSGLGGMVGDLLKLFIDNLSLNVKSYWFYEPALGFACLVILMYTLGYSIDEWKNGLFRTLFFGKIAYLLTRKIYQSLGD